MPQKQQKTELQDVELLLKNINVDDLEKDYESDSDGDICDEYNSPTKKGTGTAA